MNNKSILKRSVPNFLLLLFISLTYIFVPLPTHWSLRALPVVLIFGIFGFVRSKKKKKTKNFKKILKQLVTSYVILTTIFILFQISKGLGIIAGIILITLLAGYRIFIDTKSEESLYLDSMRSIETKIWGAPLDPIKNKRFKK